MLIDATGTSSVVQSYEQTCPRWRMLRPGVLGHLRCADHYYSRHSQEFAVVGPAQLFAGKTLVALRQGLLYRIKRPDWRLPGPRCSQPPPKSVLRLEVSCQIRELLNRSPCSAVRAQLTPALSFMINAASNSRSAD